MTTDDALHEQWCDWVGTIKQHVLVAYHHREMWQETIAAIQRVAPQSPATWMNHYATLYVDGQVMAIRRIVRGKATDVHLNRLLNGMIANPGGGWYC